MSHSKPLLMPWLRRQIDSGKYPGVLWTNPEQTEFSIPWKHALRQDSSDTDILIFKAWAEVSGNGRAHGEPSVWKRNFRSALRAKGFKVVSDNRNDAANPHKVYRWPDESSPATNSSAGSQDQDDPDFFEAYPLPTQESQDVQCLSLPEDTVFTGESSANQDILQECLKGLNICPVQESTAGREPPPEQQRLQHPVEIDEHVLPRQQQHPVVLPEQPARPMEGVVGGANAEQFLQTINMTADGEGFKTQFRVSVFYRGVMVSSQLVENEVGVRLVYRPDLNGPVWDPESGLSLVSLPSPGAMLDKTQTRLTQCILDKLGGGLDVGVSGHVVYGRRHESSQSKAFWSLSKDDRSKQPQEISKVQPQALYPFKDFVRGILGFMEGGECPPCSLFFCLGEKWPDPGSRPWERKLITVEVVLTSMELLKKMAVGGGASSLQSVELQMSLEEMMELY
ncbi:interferon regulatory factor 3 [Pseudoliparis swirei]|uniref:interferon regulatory factor 3 n=1 Tax=Pseudoliparis swirei TaxID=2059687 RepID=UPI0024BDAC2C|nr:interferon regulatory factor 3 [Pseudoliparis swirei]XP_056285667.1 interferon regulatory factor 3 [Pseudoliparis swirei]